MSIMKRIFIAAGFLCAALSLTHCSSDKEFIEDQPVIPEQPQLPETEFCEAALVARLTRTRADVSADGSQIKWVAGDELQVAVVDGSAVKNSTFSIAEADLAANLFKPVQPMQLEAQKSYDWYAVFPNVPIYPNGVFTLGDQTQAGDDNRAHLNATMLATGSASAVKATATPEINFKHHTALMKFALENQIGDVEIRGIAVKSSNAPVGGDLKVNFADHTSVLNNGVQELKLTLNPAVKVVANGTMSAYMSVAPFTLAQGDVLTITLFTDKGVVSQRMTMKQQMAFKAGCVYPTNVVVKGDKITSVIIDWIPNGIEGGLQPETSNIEGLNGTFEPLVWMEEEIF